MTCVSFISCENFNFLWIPSSFDVVKPEKFKSGFSDQLVWEFDSFLDSVNFHEWSTIFQKRPDSKCIRASFIDKLFVFFGSC
jgi:hypothetical protein